jgi:hypothetical protein
LIRPLTSLLILACFDSDQKTRENKVECRISFSLVMEKFHFLLACTARESTTSRAQHKLQVP